MWNTPSLNDLPTAIIIYLIMPLQISVDYYPGDGTAAGAPLFYKRFLYPKMAKHQRAIVVPPAFMSGFNISSESDVYCCPADTHNPADPGPNVPCHGNCTLAMLQWAKSSYDWARTDTRVVGIAPWHYYSATGPFQPGFGKMPVVLRAWQAIGKQILSGSLADVDFGI